MPVDIQIDGLDQLRRNLADLPGRLNEAAAGAIEVLGLGMVGDAKRNAPHNLGTLRATIVYMGRGMRRGDALATGVVGSSLSYAATMEAGRDANETPPPIGPIIAWVNQKSRGSRGVFQLDEPEDAIRIAYGVQTNIAKFGIVGRRYLAKALERHAPTLASRFAALMRKRLSETMTSVP